MIRVFKFKDFYFHIDRITKFFDFVEDDEEIEYLTELMDNERKAILEGTSENFSLPVLADNVAKVLSGDYSLMLSDSLEGMGDAIAELMPEWLEESGLCYIFGWLFYINGYNVKCIDFEHYIVSNEKGEIIIAEGEYNIWILCDKKEAKKIAKMKVRIPFRRNDEDIDNYYGGGDELRMSILEYEKNTEAAKLNTEWIKKDFARRKRRKQKSV